MNDLKQWADRNIDSKIVVSTVVASMAVGLGVVALRKAGFSTAAKTLKGGA